MDPPAHRGSPEPPSHQNPTILPAYFALLVGIVCLGFSAIFVRWAEAPGIVTSFYRMAIAVVFLAWPFYRRLQINGGLPSSGLRIAILGGVLFAGDVGLWASGVMLSGATNPTLLANTAPLWVGLGALLIFREELSRLFWIGLLLATFGAAVILGLDSIRNFTVGLGSLMGLLAGVFYAGYFLVTQRGRQHMDSLSYFWPAAASSAGALLLFSLVLKEPLTGYPPATYLNFLALGLITQVIGYLAINYALGYLPASIVSPTLLGQPVLTALLAIPLLGERMVPGQALGGLAVLVGIFLVHRGRQDRSPTMPS